MLFTSLLTFITIALSLDVEHVNAECCGCARITNPGGGGFCGDGTPCTPCCAYGGCNIFCCNCDNGCRPGSKHLNALEKASSMNQDSSDLFVAANTNGDGKMTFAEWCDSPARSTSKDETNKMLSKIWAKYNTADVGYLTKEEAINHKPAT